MQNLRNEFTKGIKISFVNSFDRRKLKNDDLFKNRTLIVNVEIFICLFMKK